MLVYSPISLITENPISMRIFCGLASRIMLTNLLGHGLGEKLGDNSIVLLALTELELLDETDDVRG